WQGLSYAEIAEALEIPAPAVGTVIFRARRQLARALENGAKKQLRRVAQALNLGPILAAGRSLLAGAGGAKLGATGVGVLAAGLVGGGYAVNIALWQHGSSSASEPRMRSALVGNPVSGLGQSANAKFHTPPSQDAPRVSSRKQVDQIHADAPGRTATAGGTTAAGGVPRVHS